MTIQDVTVHPQMNEKSAETLEFPKVLDRLARYTSFSASKNMALELTPTPDLDAARELMQETSEARLAMEQKTNIAFGGVFDVRTEAFSCQRGFVLDAHVLLNIHSTLRRATVLRRTFSRMGAQFPILSEIGDQLEECEALQTEIKTVLNDDGEIKDSASAKLAVIRRELKVAHDRLVTKVNNIATSQSNAKYLQEPLVTQRNGRYVIPLKAEFKGRIPGVVHDQSSSGATLWIEPLSTVEMNNKYRELQLDEENEIRRILSALSEVVGQQAEDIAHTVETLAYLDLIFARAKYADTLDASAVELVPFSPAGTNPGGTMKLIDARHPLLDQETVVPIDVELDNETYVLVITGPNTGGKTVALKTIGLLVLMSQCGLHLPVEQGSILSVFEDVYADIGDEQSIEQSLSTFSSHMTNIIAILDRANDRSLVILDELGAGTDPVEGSALARALLLELLDNSITTIISTHHPELKVFGYETPGVRNASVEFDVETLAPTYRLVIGLPGRSNALAIASRLGLPEGIIERARGMVTTEELEVDDLLDEIRKTREDTSMAYERTKDNEAESNRIRQELAERLDQIDDERHQAIMQIRAQAEEELEQLRHEIRDLRRRLQSAGQPLETINQIDNWTTELSDQLPSTGDKIERPVEDGKDRTPRLGDIVWVPSLRSEGEISEVGDNEVEVMVGQLRVRAKFDEIEYRTRRERKAEQRQRTQSRQTSTTTTPKHQPKSPGLELDVRGSRVEDALPRVEEYIDAAYMAGLPFVRIIHGKGTGALRKAIRDELLRNHPLIAKFGSGSGKEGGDGVTVVHLAEQR